MFVLSSETSVIDLIDLLSMASSPSVVLYVIR